MCGVVWCGVVWVSERAVRCEAGQRRSWLLKLVGDQDRLAGNGMGERVLAGKEGGVGTSRLEDGRPTWASS
jgi:hypothetical protein